MKISNFEFKIFSPCAIFPHQYCEVETHCWFTFAKTPEETSLKFIYEWKSWNILSCILNLNNNWKRTTFRCLKFYFHLLSSKGRNLLGCLFISQFFNFVWFTKTWTFPKEFQIYFHSEVKMDLLQSIFSNFIISLKILDENQTMVNFCWSRTCLTANFGGEPTLATSKHQIPKVRSPWQVWNTV